MDTYFVILEFHLQAGFEDAASRGDRYLSHSSRHTQVPDPVTIGSIFDHNMYWDIRGTVLLIYRKNRPSVLLRIGFLDNECSILETRLQVKF